MSDGRLMSSVRGMALLSLVGSPWCVGQVCQGMPHRHCHKRTNLWRLQALHHVLWLSLLRSNLSLVPSTACLHVGQWNMTMSGSLTCVSALMVAVGWCSSCTMLIALLEPMPEPTVNCPVLSGVVVVLPALLHVWALVVVLVIWVVCVVPLLKSSLSPFRRLASHLALPFVRSLC